MQEHTKSDIEQGLQDYETQSAIMKGLGTAILGVAAVHLVGYGETGLAVLAAGGAVFTGKSAVSSVIRAIEHRRNAHNPVDNRGEF